MKRFLASLITLVILFQCNISFADNSVQTPIVLCCENEAYSVDYIFAVTGDAAISSVTVNDDNCIYDWNYVRAEAKLYISLASGQPINKCKEIINVISNNEIKLTPVSVMINGVSADMSCLKHNEVDMPEIKPTHDESGKKGGKMCSICKTVLKEHDTDIPPIGNAIYAEILADGSLEINGALTDDTSLDGTLILAIYSNKELKKVMDISDSNPSDISIVIEKMDDADTVKIFQWDAFTNMRPLNNVVVATVKNYN